MEKIPTTIKTQRINEWITLFPSYKRVGKVRISKLVSPFVFTIELVWSKFDNSKYVPYNEVSSCISSLGMMPEICINRQSKFDTGHVIYMDTFEHHNIQAEVINFAEHDFAPFINSTVSVQYLIELFEQEIESGRAIFGTHLALYRNLLYLYSISNTTENQKTQKYDFYMEKIKNNEIAFRRLYKHTFDERVGEIEQFFNNPQYVDKEINLAIKKFKLDNMKNNKLIIN